LRGAGFADGHVEGHTWRDDRTVDAGTKSGAGIESFFWSGGDASNPDFVWVWNNYRYVNWQPLP
jgi:hypothetical protein